MPERQSMRRIRECYRLYYENGLSQQQIARAISVGRSTVWDYLHRLSSRSLSWQDLRHLSDEELERLLFSVPAVAPKRPVPDWAQVHEELCKNSTVTLRLLWEEYNDEVAGGYSYPQYCRYYREWAKKLKVYLRGVHVGGERVFVDYSGKRLHITDLKTGEMRPVELFVMAWGASHYLYAEAQESQSLPCWIMGHVRAFEYFGCVPHLVVPDNLKNAVTKAHLYDPDINRTYTDLAQHYGFGVLPARPGKPKDKPKVEGGVLILQRWILAALRNRVFHTMTNLNAAVRELVEKANSKPLQKLKQTRKERFIAVDKPNTLDLPASSFQFHEWSKATAGFDYHIEVNRHFYSVPWTLYGQQLDIRINERSVEVFHKQSRVALHHRNTKEYGYTTNPQHMPSAHQRFLEWTPSRLLTWAKKIGSNTHLLVNKIISTKTHPQQGFRPAMGILRLSKSFGEGRLEAACGIALELNTIRYKEVNQILKKGLDQKADSSRQPIRVVQVSRVRGAQYYNDKICDGECAIQQERTGS